MSDQPDAPMRSAVNWALLGLVIERPSYAYELARRFERTYRGVLSLSSRSHVYTALSSLQHRSLIEEVAGTRAGRQPRPSYRATPAGIQSYAEWLVSYVGEDRRRQALFVLGLSALASDVNSVAEILDRYEQAWLAQANHTPPASIEGGGDQARASFVARVLCEENRLGVEAKLSWLADLREQVEQLASEQGAEADGSAAPG
jgi:DNA-binding PadR family transcriptional regulator